MQTYRYAILVWMWHGWELFPVWTTTMQEAIRQVKNQLVNNYGWSTERVNTLRFHATQTTKSDDTLDGIRQARPYPTCPWFNRNDRHRKIIPKSQQGA